MKIASPARIVNESLRYFIRRGFVTHRTDAATEYVGSLMPMLVGSVDRLEEMPDRVGFVFDFDAEKAVAREDVGPMLDEPGAREVIAALPAAIESPMLDKEAFRAMAARVKERTGQKGKALFHPIRAALTGESGGPELDMAVPAIERGAGLPREGGVREVRGCRARAEEFARAVRARS
jgi:glutamyl/glutaminyl-tRNA synthetase